MDGDFMDLLVGYGDGSQAFTIRPENLIGILSANTQNGQEIDEYGEVVHSLRHPIGTPRLSQIVKPGERIAILTSDITRPFPTYKVLPAVLDELLLANIDLSDVTVVFCLGSHRKHTDEEKKRLMGVESFDIVKSVDSSEDPFVHMGATSRGTPIDIAETVAAADRRICLGNIEYHYFAGYSGGYKAIMPGASTYSAIEKNHSLMIDPCASTGKLEGNPVREDIEEAGRLVGVDFIVNVVLDEEKRILRSYAGDPIEAHRAGCAFLDSLYHIDIKEAADIVIASQGGLPKDVNLYQLQKALDNANRAVRDGGIIILVGCCREGFGNAVFEEWMRTAETPDDLIRFTKDNFRLGGHKASAVAKVLNRSDVYLVSEIEDDVAESCFFRPFNTVDSALQTAFAKLGDNACVLVMPHAGSTMPCVETP